MHPPHLRDRFFFDFDFLRFDFFLRAAEAFESVEASRFERFNFLCLRRLRRRSSSESELEPDESESELEELLAGAAAWPRSRSTLAERLYFETDPLLCGGTEAQSADDVAVIVLLLPPPLLLLLPVSTVVDVTSCVSGRRDVCRD